MNILLGNIFLRLDIQILKILKFRKYFHDSLETLPQNIATLQYLVSAWIIMEVSIPMSYWTRYTPYTTEEAAKIPQEISCDKSEHSRWVCRTPPVKLKGGTYAIRLFIKKVKREKIQALALVWIWTQSDCRSCCAIVGPHVRGWK